MTAGGAGCVGSRGWRDGMAGMGCLGDGPLRVVFFWGGSLARSRVEVSNGLVSWGKLAGLGGGMRSGFIQWAGRVGELYGFYIYMCCAGGVAWCGGGGCGGCGGCGGVAGRLPWAQL